MWTFLVLPDSSVPGDSNAITTIPIGAFLVPFGAFQKPNKLHLLSLACRFFASEFSAKKTEPNLAQHKVTGEKSEVGQAAKMGQKCSQNAAKKSRQKTAKIGEFRETCGACVHVYRGPTRHIFISLTHVKR